MVVRRLLVALIASLMLAHCSVYQTETVTRIALLAPFEGPYREIGYEALYAAQLALADYNVVELLAVDDGGRVETAQLRMAALDQDDAVGVVIALGHHATRDSVQQMTQRPILIAGHWHTMPAHEHVFLLANQAIDEQITFENDLDELNTREHVRGSEMLALTQVPTLLGANAEQLTIFSSGQLADSDFRQRYIESAEFAPQPYLIAPLVYDATQIAIQAITQHTPINTLVYEGINGIIQFENGYWHNAPIHRYQYINDQLTHIATE
ncbi:MAG: hypothetical protein ACFE0Q_20005 [Anaerolineae bacterium]